MVRVSLRFTSCHFQFLSPNYQFYYFTSPHVLQDVENHCAHLKDIELKTGRKIPYLRFPHVLLSMYWIGEHEITKLKKYICFSASNPEKKRTQKQVQKDMNQMEWHNMDYLIFSAMRIRKPIYFARLVTTTYCVKNNQSSTRCLRLEMSLC